jgi:hypothetical protein
MACLFKHLSYLLAIYQIASIALRPPPPLVIVLRSSLPETATQVHGEWLRGVFDEVVGFLLVGSELPEDLALGQTATTQEEGLGEVVGLVLLKVLEGRRFMLRVNFLGVGVVKVRVGRRS